MSSTKNTDTDTDDALDRVLSIAEQNHENIQLAAVELGCEDELDLSVTPRGSSDSSKSLERTKAAYLGAKSVGADETEDERNDETAADLTASLMSQNAANLQKLTDEGLGVGVGKTAGDDPLAQTKRAFFGV